jgi:hypothetical protein
VNWKLAETLTGIKRLSKDFHSVVSELGERIVFIRDSYYFLPKFIKFQYPGFPKSNVRQQESAIKILVSFGLYDAELNSFLTLSKQLANPYDNDSDINILNKRISNSNNNIAINSNAIYSNSNNSSNSNSSIEKKKYIKEKEKLCLLKNSNVTIEVVAENFLKTKDLINADPDYYYNCALDWSDSNGKMKVDWMATIRNFVRRDIRDGKMKQRKYQGLGSLYSSSYNSEKRMGDGRPKTQAEILEIIKKQKTDDSKL